MIPAHPVLGLCRPWREKDVECPIKVRARRNGECGRAGAPFAALRAEEMTATPSRMIPRPPSTTTPRLWRHEDAYMLLREHATVRNDSCALARSHEAARGESSRKRRLRSAQIFRRRMKRGERVSVCSKNRVEAESSSWRARAKGTSATLAAPELPGSRRSSP